MLLDNQSFSLGSSNVTGNFNRFRIGGALGQADPTIGLGNIDDFRYYDYVADATFVDYIYKLGNNTNVASLSGVSMSNLQNAGATISQLITTGITVTQLLEAGFTQIEIDIALTQIKIHSDFTISDGTSSSVFRKYMTIENALNGPNVFESTEVKTTTPFGKT